VIIASFNEVDTIGRCLNSLREQKTDRSFEVIIIDSSTDGTAEIVRQGFPEARLVTFPERKFCGGARNAGLTEARGEIIALIDADCTADPGWVDAILAAHEAPHLAIGGAIANADAAGPVGWAGYLCEFSRWMPGREAGWMNDVAGANMSYKRRAFEEHGRFLEGTYCSDTEFHWRLAQAGQGVWFDPAVVVQHHGISGLGRLLSHEFAHGRSFARVRVAARGFSPLRRTAYALFWWLILPKLLFTIAANCVRNRRVARLMVSLPLLGLGLGAWCLGEALGYIEGRRDA
jgi:GT2 family glycosyltransferase